MDELKLDAAVNNAVVFVSCMNYEHLVKYKTVLKSYRISLAKELRNLNEDIRSCISKNANIVSTLYLDDFEKSVKIYNKNNDRKDMESIITLISDISDAELEVFSVDEFDGGAHIVSRQLASIIETDNKHSEEMLNTDKSRFSAYVVELERVLDYYSIKSNRLKNSINTLSDCVSGVNIAIQYILKELKLDKNNTSAFMDLSATNKKSKLTEFVLKKGEAIII